MIPDDVVLMVISSVADYLRPSDPLAYRVGKPSREDSCMAYPDCEGASLTDTTLCNPLNRSTTPTETCENQGDQNRQY